LLLQLLRCSKKFRWNLVAKMRRELNKFLFITFDFSKNKKLQKRRIVGIYFKEKFILC
jgi:hypothetical protein